MGAGGGSGNGGGAMKISDMQITEWRAAIARVEAGDLHAGPDVTTAQLTVLLDERERLRDALREIEAANTTAQLTVLLDERERLRDALREIEPANFRYGLARVGEIARDALKVGAA
jgi:hypothetical protein